MKTPINLFEVTFTKFPGEESDLTDKIPGSIFETVIPGSDKQWFVRMYAWDMTVREAFERWVENQKTGTVKMTLFGVSGEPCYEREFKVSAKHIGPLLLSKLELQVLPDYEVGFDVA